MSKDKIKAIVFFAVSIICIVIAVAFGMPLPGIFHQWACNLIYIAIGTGILALIYAFIPQLVHGRWKYIIAIALIVGGAWGYIAGHVLLLGFAMIVIGVFLLLTDLSL